MHVSVLAIIIMVISAVVSIGLPVVLFIVFRKKYNAGILPMITGIAGFVVFALLLESFVHTMVIDRFALREKPLIFVIYAVFMAGIFEETARFIFFNLLKKKYTGIGTGLAYGIGHGGIESVVLAGLSMINAIIVSIIINSGNIETITAGLQGAALEQTNAQIASLLATPPHLFLIGGIERLFALCMQLSLSVIVFYSVYGKNRLWLYPCAVALHAMADVPAVLMQVGVITNVYIVELLVFAISVILILIAKYIHGKCGGNDAAGK
ncbi:MAG: YhfC family intramembrane metalloprotease [Treponema sp.]|jgi:uncharacterized membrane protein YhfC|nr:YhfC family intramembrane metalloprotease [Treponema sp.]